MDVWSDAGFGLAFLVRLLGVVCFLGAWPSSGLEGLLVHPRDCYPGSLQGLGLHQIVGF